MKRLFLAFLALIVAANPLFPQKPGNKSVFGVNAGLSVPYNEFAQTTFKYDAGFAGPGPNIEAEFLRYGRFIGFSSSIGYASIFFKEKDYQAEYDRVLNGYGTNEVTAGNYQVLKCLVGFTLKLPEIKRTEVMLLFHLGVALSVHPNLVVTNSELGEINSITRSAGRSSGANAGLKVNYWLTDKYGINLNFSQNMTRPWFRDETGIGGSFFLPIHYSNANIGFVMQLNAKHK
jgi:hypothetical protein